MAKPIKYLEFTITLDDKEQVVDLQATYPDGILMAPETAALTYSANMKVPPAPLVAPMITSPWFLPNSDYKRNVASFTRKSGGWFGISFLFGTTYTYKWVGKFAYAATATPEIGGTPTEIVAIAQRKWITSFDLPRHGGTGDGGPEYEFLGDGMLSLSRDASRHPEGRGFACRTAGDVVTQSPTASGAAASKSNWERFYIRVRRYPATVVPVWSAVFGSPDAIALKMSSDGRLQLANYNNVGTETLHNTTADVIPLNTWTRVDITFVAGSSTGDFNVWFNRKTQIDVTLGVASGLGANENHSLSRLGFNGTATVAEFDFDDWVGAALPSEDSNGRYTGIDWLNGSYVKSIPMSGFGAGNAWIGDWRQMLQETPQQAPLTAEITSIVSGAALVAQADESKYNDTPGAIGPVSFAVVGALEQDGVAAVSTMGWRFDALLDLAATSPALSASNNWARRMYRPSGLTVPIANLMPFEFHHVKAANITTAHCKGMFLVVEFVGTFGEEDVPTASEPDVPAAIPLRLGLHNAPYPETPWAKATLPAIAPVVVHSGTYVGTGTFIDLTFRTNVNWFFVRRVFASGQTGSLWFSSQNAGSTSGQQGPNSGFIAQATIDPSLSPSGVEDAQEQRVVLRILGGDVTLNELASSYEYVAVMDPGARFQLNGAFAHVLAGGGATSQINLLRNPTFLPEYTFFHLGRFGQGSSTNGRIVKGPGHAAPNAQGLDAVEVATGATIVAGQITSHATLQDVAQNPVAYSAWRSNDGSGDPNYHKVVKILTYTGDGSASRTIGFPAPTGLRPLFAIVTPHNNFSWFRDPSHLTNTSTSHGSGSTGTTAITSGGIDSITAGITLNANAVVHEVFVLMGSATAGNGGWSIDGEFAYVEPDWLAGGESSDPEDAIEEIDDSVEPEEPDPDPGPSDVDDCEAGEVCVIATTREVNLALLEIGNTKFLTNYCTQNTLEAQTARILYEASVRAVLHEFPWPFATKYAAMALTAAQPSHEDWAFSYRVPVDCIFPRRIVIDRGPGVDSKGPGFELSSDASGGILLTNEASAVLEYTCRPACVAYTGDALFRESVKWHLAGAMAPPLTRMADKAKFCREQYDLCIAKANAIIKPGQPGLRTALDPASNDGGAACQTANTMVANVALIRIGANTIANLVTDQSREATAVNLLFEHELRATLRDFPWKFAKRYNEALVTVAGTTTVPANVDWQYSYRLPSDYVAVRRLATTGTGRSFETDPPTFEVGTDATGYLLFTGELDPNLEYTARLPCAVSKSDDLFRDALAWRLSASLAPSLAQRDPEGEEARGRGPEYPPNPEQRISHRPNQGAMRERAARYAMGMYYRVIEKARVVDANEADPEPHGEAPWISGRD